MAADLLKKLMSSLLSSLTSRPTPDHTSPNVFKDAAAGPPTAEGSTTRASSHRGPKLPDPVTGPRGIRESGSSKEVEARSRLRIPLEAHPQLHGGHSCGGRRDPGCQVLEAQRACENPAPPILGCAWHGALRPNQRGSASTAQRLPVVVRGEQCGQLDAVLLRRFYNLQPHGRQDKDHCHTPTACAPACRMGVPRGTQGCATRGREQS